MTDGEDRFLNDAGLDRLLAMASRPEPLPGFEERLARRMAESAASGGNVIAFRPRQKPLAPPARALRWPFVAALAASLVIGLWLGSSAQVSSFLDQASETALLDTGTGFAPAGLDELGSAEGDSLS